MAMKIASMKKEKPSSANASPKTSPKAAMKPGQSRPSSKLRIVPVTTPTAKSASIAFDQRLASVRSIGSPVLRWRHSAKSTSAGNAIPKQTRGMCTTNESACIWRASKRYGWWTDVNAVAISFTSQSSHALSGRVPGRRTGSLSRRVLGRGPRASFGRFRDEVGDLLRLLQHGNVAGGYRDRDTAGFLRTGFFHRGTERVVLCSDHVPRRL